MERRRKRWVARMRILKGRSTVTTDLYHAEWRLIGSEKVGKKNIGLEY